MHTLTATPPDQLRSVTRDELFELFNQQLARLRTRLDLPTSAAWDKHLAGLQRAVLAASKLVLTPTEAPLLIAIPPQVSGYAEQMELLTYDGKTGMVSVTGEFTSADETFRPRLPYLYLGVDRVNRGRTTDLAEQAISTNHRVHLTAEGLIAHARENPNITHERDLMCFGTCFGPENPAVLRLELEPLTGKRLALTFVSRRSDYVRDHWQNYRHPSAQRRIAL